MNFSYFTTEVLPEKLKVKQQREAFLALVQQNFQSPEGPCEDASVFDHLFDLHVFFSRQILCYYVKKKTQNKTQNAFPLALS